MANTAPSSILNMGMSVWTFPRSHFPGSDLEKLILLEAFLTWKNCRKCIFKRPDTSVMFRYMSEGAQVFRDCRALAHRSAGAVRPVMCFLWLQAGLQG